MSFLKMSLFGAKAETQEQRQMTNVNKKKTSNEKRKMKTHKKTSN